MPTKTSPLTPQYRYNDVSMRYIGADGRFVPQRQVRAALDNVISASASNIEAASLRLQSGQISTAEWQMTMARELKTLHTASTAATKGGWAQVTQADWGRTGQRLREQYRYLQNFAREVATGKQPLNGRFIRRAKMYAQSARGTYEQTRRKDKEAQGWTDERRVRTAQESCPGCISQSALNWQPIGTLDPIGAEECLTYCACYFQYRQMDKNGKYVISE